MDQSNLLDRADAALAEAGRQRDELNRNIARGWAICRRAHQALTFREGLRAPLAISLNVENYAAEMSSATSPSANGS